MLVNAAAAAAAGDGKELQLAPIERLLAAVSSGLLQTGGRVLRMGREQAELAGCVALCAPGVLIMEPLLPIIAIACPNVSPSSPCLQT